METRRSMEGHNMQGTANTLNMPKLMQTYLTGEDAIRYMEHIRWGDTPYRTRCSSTDRISPNKKGVSALQLKHEIKASYSTAWYTLHRLRLACPTK